MSAAVSRGDGADAVSWVEDAGLTATLAEPPAAVLAVIIAAWLPSMAAAAQGCTAAAADDAATAQLLPYADRHAPDFFGATAAPRSSATSAARCCAAT